MRERVMNKALELLANGTVDRVMGWKRGEFCYDLTPAVFETKEEIEKYFVFDCFCGANLSKYCIAQSAKGGKIAVFLKPCDSLSFQQLLKEHRIARENVYIVGITCDGMCDPQKLGDGVLSYKEEGESLILETLYEEKAVSRDALLLERCKVCKSKDIVIFDELLGEQKDMAVADRFEEVAKLEEMTSEERFAFWRKELSRCIRCNACRNVCPACSCVKCVFDNADSGVRNKAAADSFEENMFHIIRAFHVAGRCTDCGECSRVCPQNIPLHLLNRKFIKDINELYGTYQAGADMESKSPLTDFTYDDCEASIVHERGGKA